MLDRLEVDIEKVESTIGDKLHMLDKDKDGVLSTGELSEVHRTTTQYFLYTLHRNQPPKHGSVQDLPLLHMPPDSPDHILVPFVIR